MKWDVFNYTLDNKKWLVAALGSDSTETVDYKRPISVRVYDPKTNDLLEEQEQKETKMDGPIFEKDGVKIFIDKERLAETASQHGPLAALRDAAMSERGRLYAADYLDMILHEYGDTLAAHECRDLKSIRDEILGHTGYMARLSYLCEASKSNAKNELP